MLFVMLLHNPFNRLSFKFSEPNSGPTVKEHFDEGVPKGKDLHLKKKFMYLILSLAIYNLTNYAQNTFLIDANFPLIF